MEMDDIDSSQQPATAVTTTAVTRGGFGSSRQQWPHSSRIIRVSRASGGKDRHSKVWTAKGPRDRRVRLSVNTAIQFYDLQDRLGYDQPSKAVEWLIKAAAEAINELPCLDSSNFPTTTVTAAGAGNFSELPNCLEMTDHHGGGQQKLVQVGGSMSKSGCSSNNSDTSKGSGLSLSRSEIRVKARERARERTTAKEKEESSEPPPPPPPPPLSRVSGGGGGGGGQSSSFTQLLTAGFDRASSATTTTSYHNNNNNNNNNIPMVADYFGSGFMGLSANRFGNAPLPHVMSLLPFSGSHEIQHHHQHHQHQHQHQHQHEHQQQQQSSFLSDNHSLVHQVPNTTTTTTSTAGGSGVSSDYNLNFSISSSSNGFNRGTLQSNSTSTSSPPPSFLSYLSSSSVPFYLGGAPISPVVDNQQHHHHVHHYHHDHNHHQFNPAELQLRYGDGTGGRHSDQKGKGKN